MTALFVTVLVASLTGSLHCAGMCGPFVAFAVGTEGSQAGRVAAYHGGRLCSYAGLGLLAGLVGSALDFGGTVVGIQRLAMVIAGAAMVLFGVVSLLRLAGARIGPARPPKFLREISGRVHRRLTGVAPLPRALAIGLASTLLPCGWLYAFVVTAAGSGSPWSGAAMMTAFWLGTLPVLTALGVLARRLAGPALRFVPALTAVALVLVGLFAISSRFDMPPLRAAEPADITATPPCCAREE